VRRLTLLICLLACALAAGLAGSAHAGGSLRAAVQARLDQDSQTLATLLGRRASDVRRLQHVSSALPRQADPFPAQDRADRLRHAIKRENVAIARLRREISGLKKALRPPPPPIQFSTQPTSAVGQEAVAIAERYLGVEYTWGGDMPGTGFDCSGFVRFVYAQLGIDLPHYAASQYDLTRHIPTSMLEPGDLVFFEPHSDGPGHVGIYTGDGYFIDAPYTGSVVRFDTVNAVAKLVGFVGASRPS
jgi:cell wall-associated NlpC family hydrolase